MKFAVLTLLVWLLATVSAWALEDTPALDEKQTHAALESSGCAYMVSVMLEESMGVKTAKLIYLHCCLCTVTRSESASNVASISMT